MMLLYSFSNKCLSISSKFSVIEYSSINIGAIIINIDIVASTCMPNNTQLSGSRTTHIDNAINAGYI